MSASDKTQKGSLPPNSRVVFFKCFPQSSAICDPAYVLPVNFTAASLLSLISSAHCSLVTNKFTNSPLSNPLPIVKYFLLTLSGNNFQSQGHFEELKEIISAKSDFQEAEGKTQT